jgi:hypothetical protein
MSPGERQTLYPITAGVDILFTGSRCSVCQWCVFVPSCPARPRVQIDGHIKAAAVPVQQKIGSRALKGGPPNFQLDW